jgi:hypothetical protein
MNNKTLMGGIVAGVLYFGLGYLVWGILLEKLMAENAGTATNVMREGDPEWLTLVIGNLFSGFALSYVLNKAGANSMGSGIVVGATIGFLWATGFDFTMLGVSNLFTVKGAIIDIAASTVVSGVIGGLTCWVLGMSKKTG